jgi:hypothetical protein
MGNRQRIADDLGAILLGSIIGMAAGTPSCLVVVTMVMLMSGWTDAQSIVVMVAAFTTCGSLFFAILGSVLFVKYWRHFGRLPTLKDTDPWNAVDNCKPPTRTASLISEQQALLVGAFFVIGYYSATEYSRTNTLASLPMGAISFFLLAILWWLVEFSLRRRHLTGLEKPSPGSCRNVSGISLPLCIHYLAMRIRLPLFGAATGALLFFIDEANCLRLATSMILAVLAVRFFLGGLLLRMVMMYRAISGR